MKHAAIAIMLAAAAVLSAAGPASAADVGGAWTKTTHSDPENVTVFFSEGKTVKAIGYGRIGGGPAIWHAEGRFAGGALELSYHYSSDATPPGWEPDGTMRLTLSADGKTLSGTATSKSGNWSGRVEFKRAFLSRR